MIFTKMHFSYIFTYILYYLFVLTSASDLAIKRVFSKIITAKPDIVEGSIDYLK